MKITQSPLQNQIQRSFIFSDKIIADKIVIKEINQNIKEVEKSNWKVNRYKENKHNRLAVIRIIEFFDLKTSLSWKGKYLEVA